MSIAPLRTFVRELTRLADRHADDEAAMLDGARLLLADLLAAEPWLPRFCARPHPRYYQQYLLHCDPAERFSIVSFVWGPSQETPVHDHRTWGLVGMLMGAEIGTRYVQDAGRLVAGASVRLEPGDIEALSPTLGDIHKVRNAFADRTSVSIHVYGANIGAVERSAFQPDGRPVPFVSGYSAGRVPNLWDMRGQGAGWDDEDMADPADGGAVE